ncbi:MAG: hypothetical protein AUK44_06655 [Porphyromonadaceae bacterium CG2_30_38_12]|nr:MAG: hypothetical protein AUK44_06655 [Porphyromonadaceae bacterium CG2_30_38_12]
MKKTTILIGLFVCSINGFSQDSLIHYLELATKNNPTVLQRYNHYQAALQKVPQVSSLPDPQLEMGIFLSPMELMAGNQVADIKLMQMLPWFGVIKNAKDEMSLMAKASFESFRDAKLQVYYDVQRVWFDLYKIRQNIRISQENVDVLKTIERLTLVKFKSGSLSDGSSASSGGTGLTDLYQIQIEIGTMENAISTLKNKEQVVIARLNSLLNSPQTTTICVSDFLSAEPLDSSLLSVSDSLFIQNPMLSMLHYEQLSLDARSKMQKQMGLPMVGIGLNYSVISKAPMSTSTMNGQDMIMPMLTITLPIYRKKYNAQQAETKFSKLATQQNYQATANALQTEYYEALQQYNDAQRRMKLYDSQSRLAKKMLDISIKSFSSSSNIGLTAILRIQKQLLDYELEQVGALVDFNHAKAIIHKLTINNK